MKRQLEHVLEAQGLQHLGELDEILDVLRQSMPGAGMEFPPVIIPSREAINASAVNAPVVAGFTKLAKSVDGKTAEEYRDFLAAVFEPLLLPTSVDRDAVLDQLSEWATGSEVVDAPAGRVTVKKAWLDVRATNALELLEPIVQN